MAIPILFLAAEPTDTAHIRVGEESREIKEKLQLSGLRDKFSLHQRFAVRAEDISQALLDLKPQIVHFSGHGISSGEICIEDSLGNMQSVSPEALATLFEQFANQVKCVVLNACYMKNQALAISKHIDYVIGTSNAIGDRAAIAFSIGFYQALGAGRSIENSYKLGRTQIALQNIPEDLTPILEVKNKDLLKHNDDIVVLIGAGVSNYLGLPTLDGLLEQAVIGDDDVANRIKNTRNVVEAYTKRAKARFEELIGQLRYYLDVAEMLRKDNNFSNEMNGPLPHTVVYGSFRQKWWDALTRCYRIILQEYGPQKINKNCEEFKTILGLLDELAMINSRQLHIYTTNYDCSFQVLASTSENLIFYTHIDNVSGAFTNYWYHANPDQDSLDQPAIYVHRFHGCVAWFNNQTRPFGIEEVYGAGGELEIRDDEKLHGMAIKLTSSQSIGTNPAFALAFEEFAEHLKNTKTLLVWGYSFRDIEILRYINQAIAQQSKLVVLYIDPYMGKEEVLQNVRATLSDAPIAINPKFKPIRIDWKPHDGHEQLIKRTVETIKNTTASLSDK